MSRKIIIIIKYINEAQSKLHSIGPKLMMKQTVRFPKKCSKHAMPTKS